MTMAALVMTEVEITQVDTEAVGVVRAVKSWVTTAVVLLLLVMGGVGL